MALSFGLGLPPAPKKGVGVLPPVPQSGFAYLYVLNAMGSRNLVTSNDASNITRPVIAKGVGA